MEVLLHPVATALKSHFQVELYLAAEQFSLIYRRFSLPWGNLPEKKNG
jgi:hypothetical protein